MGATSLSAIFERFRNGRDAMNAYCLNLLLNPNCIADTLEEDLVHKGVLSRRFAPLVRRTHEAALNTLHKKLLNGDFTFKPVINNIRLLLQNVVMRIMPVVMRGSYSPAFAAMTLTGLTVILYYQSMDHSALTHLSDQFSQAVGMVKSWHTGFHHDEDQAGIVTADLDQA